MSLKRERRNERSDQRREGKGCCGMREGYREGALNNGKELLDGEWKEGGTASWVGMGVGEGEGALGKDRKGVGGVRFREERKPSWIVGNEGEQQGVREARRKLKSFPQLVQFKDIISIGLAPCV